MHSYRQVISLRVDKRMAFINITPQVQEALAKSGIRDGLCLVNSMHITSSVFINDDEAGLHEDYGRWLDSATTEPDPLLPLLRPYPGEDMEAYPVSTLVNSPAHEDAKCVERL